MLGKHDTLILSFVPYKNLNLGLRELNGLLDTPSPTHTLANGRTRIQIQVHLSP